MELKKSRSSRQLCQNTRYTLYQKNTLMVLFIKELKQRKRYTCISMTVITTLLPACLLSCVVVIIVTPVIKDIRIKRNIDATTYVHRVIKYTTKQKEMIGCTVTTVSVILMENNVSTFTNRPPVKGTLRAIHTTGANSVARL